MLFALLGLFMFSVISQAADRAKQIKDLGRKGVRTRHDGDSAPLPDRQDCGRSRSYPPRDQAWDPRE